MDAEQFEVLVAAILIAGRTAGARRDSGMRPISSLVGDMTYAIRDLRAKGFTSGTSQVPEE